MKIGLQHPEENDLEGDANEFGSWLNFELHDRCLL